MSIEHESYDPSQGLHGKPEDSSTETQGAGKVDTFTADQIREDAEELGIPFEEALAIHNQFNEELDRARAEVEKQMQEGTLPPLPPDVQERANKFIRNLLQQHIEKLK